MTRTVAGARVHVVGAGLAGLSAAVTLAGRGVPVVLSDAARQAGGRCRSYHDGVLDMEIDNGNHLAATSAPSAPRIESSGRPGQSSRSSTSPRATPGRSVRMTGLFRGGLWLPGAECRAHALATISPWRP